VTNCASTFPFNGVNLCRYVEREKSQGGPVVVTASDSQMTSSVYLDSVNLELYHGGAVQVDP
jgi:hypothetical protein